MFLGDNSSNRKGAGFWTATASFVGSVVVLRLIPGVYMACKMLMSSGDKDDY
jgi:hypothetical protein